MEALLPLALLACPIGMGLMMWFMMRGQRSEKTSPEVNVEQARLTDLQAEHDRLGGEIARLEGDRENGQRSERGQGVAGAPR